MSTLSPTRPPVFNNLANQLTAARLGLAIVLFGLIAAHAWVWCVVVFAAAAFTDWLDGYLAPSGPQQCARTSLRSARGQGTDFRGLYLSVAREGRGTAAVDGHGRGRPRTDHHGAAELPGKPGDDVRGGLAGQAEDGPAMRRPCSAFSSPCTCPHPARPRARSASSWACVTV